jgi:DNA modification methylase
MVLRINSKWLEKEGAYPAYATSMGRCYRSSIEEFLASTHSDSIRGKVDLIITSPPFPLVHPKRYGNKVSDEYIDWISGMANPLSDLLSETGSLVIEIGNAWTKGLPIMSTVPLEALIEFGKRSNLELCQQFICHNPARLPSPAPWVTIKRVRVKDSYTHVWWFSKTENPKADNRKVLQAYSPSMKKLISRGSYNHGKRPSDHKVSEKSFLTDNGGSIPASALTFANTNSPKNYRDWCIKNDIRPHPARMQSGLLEFFIKFLTDEGDLVFDPFGGSNTTGSVSESLSRKWIVTEPSNDYVLGSIGRFT